MPREEFGNEFELAKYRLGVAKDILIKNILGLRFSLKRWGIASVRLRKSDTVAITMNSISHLKRRLKGKLLVRMN